jgi:hypothetical protein
MRPDLYAAALILLFAACNNKKEATLSEFKAIEVKYPTTKKDTTVKDRSS